MVVISLTNCPPSLRGDLTKWLQEISAGVYAGTVNARVRDELWQRIKANVANGSAVMVFSAANEQGMDFRVHQTGWQPIDFDGLKLMLRPRREAVPVPQKALAPGFSRESVSQMVKRIDHARRRRTGTHPQEYIVTDLETTGLSPQKDEIWEIAALHIHAGQPVGQFHSLLCTEKRLSEDIIRLTGVSDETLRTDGRSPDTVLREYLQFIDGLPLVCHNAAFDYEFLRVACMRHDLLPPRNQAIDTYQMARILVDDTDNYKLSTLADYFDLPGKPTHRSLPDCEATWLLYEKLIEIQH